MDKNKALQNLLMGKATKKEIELLKQALASGEISIGGDVNRSVVIIGSGNKIELTTEALNLLKPETKNEEPVEGNPPYMGLRYFDTQDADLFYGRDVLTRELLLRVEKESFLAIVGASGSGKSSVARAGLIPAWQKENERGAIHVITPTTYPLESLAASLTRESESVTATSMLMDDLKNDSRSLRLYVKKTFGETKMLLLVDQFEETFTLCKDADERKAFIENLLTLADDVGDARVVITLRADFYHHCAKYERLRQALEIHQAYIGAMKTDELRQAITMPAKKNSWDFQPGLVDLILSDVDTEPGALPLLSHALLETWKRKQGHMLTLKGYHEAGGVKKAIAQTAENVYDKLTPAEQTIARGIFLRLTRLDESDEGRDTRKRVEMNDLLRVEFESSSSIVLLINKLANARLIVSTLNLDKIEIEVAHEALIRHWERLRTWLNEDRNNLRLREGISEATRDWNANLNNSDLLIHLGRRLEEALRLTEANYLPLTIREKNYLEACIQKNSELEKIKVDYEIEKKLRQLLVSLQKVAGLISENSNLDEVLEATLSELEHNLPIDIACIWLLEEGDLHLSATHGINVSTLENTCKVNPESKFAMMEALRANTTTLRQPDEALWPVGLSAGYDQNYSDIAVPLWIGHRQLGLFTIAHQTAGRYGQEEQTFIEAFANYTSAVIENSRLFDSAQEQAYLSAGLLQVAQAVISLDNLDETLYAIIRIMPILVGVERVALYRFGATQEDFYLSNEYGFSEDEKLILIKQTHRLGTFPLLDRTREGKRTVFYTMTHDVLPSFWSSLQPDSSSEKESLNAHQLLIAAPLAIDNDFFGVMLIQEAESGRRFRTRRIEIINGIAQLISAAIRNEILAKTKLQKGALNAE